MKITVDTNFLISATQWDNSVAHKLLLKLIDIEAEIYTTSEIIGEFAKVLGRDFKYEEKEISFIIEKIMSVLILIETKEKINIIKNDPSDNKIIECAVESFSDYLITYDKKHLLVLGDYKGIKIITPEELIRIMRI